MGADHAVADILGTAAVVAVQSPGLRPAAEDVRLIRETMGALAEAPAGGLDIARPRPTAAFSRRDTLLPGYPQAEAAVRSHGFTPMIRPVGGHLAAYDEGSLILHLWAPHQDARSHVKARFELLGDALVKCLRALGADARLGPVPGEYCNGEFSINDTGRSKLVGTGQRITRSGYLFSAVVMVRDVQPARKVLAEAYAQLGLPFRPETVGCLADSVPGVTLEEVRRQLADALRRVFPAHVDSLDLAGSGGTAATSAWVRGVGVTSAVATVAATCWPLRTTRLLRDQVHWQILE